MKNRRIFVPRHLFAVNLLGFSKLFSSLHKPGWVGILPFGRLPQGVAASQSGLIFLPKLRHHAHRNFHTTGAERPENRVFARTRKIRTAIRLFQTGKTVLQSLPPDHAGQTFSGNLQALSAGTLFSYLRQGDRREGRTRSAPRILARMRSTGNRARFRGCADRRLRRGHLTPSSPRIPAKIEAGKIPLNHLISIT